MQNGSEIIDYMYISENGHELHNKITMGQLYYLYYLKKFIKIHDNNPLFSFNDSYAYNIANKYFYDKFGKKILEKNKQLVSSKLNIDINKIPKLKTALKKLEKLNSYKTQNLTSLIPQRFPSRTAKNKEYSTSFTNPKNVYPYFKTPSDKELRSNYKKNLRKYLLKKKMMNAVQKQAPPSQIHLTAAPTSHSPDRNIQSKKTAYHFKNNSSSAQYRHVPTAMHTSTENNGTGVGAALDVYSSNPIRPTSQSSLNAADYSAQHTAASPNKISRKKVSPTLGHKNNRNKKNESCIGCFSRLLRNDKPKNQRVFYSFEPVRPTILSSTQKNVYRLKKPTKISPNMTSVNNYKQRNVQVSGVSPRLKVLQTRSSSSKAGRYTDPKNSQYPTTSKRSFQ